MQNAGESEMNDSMFDRNYWKAAKATVWEWIYWLNYVVTVPVRDFLSFFYPKDFSHFQERNLTNAVGDIRHPVP